jgi:predicted kinase
MPPLILLIGLPGSGKSTIARTLLQQDLSCRLISTDAIRAQLFGNESIQGSWLKIEQAIIQQFQQTVQQILSQQLAAGIYDATNAVRRQRREALMLARTCGFTQIVGVWVKTPLWLCLHRNQHRDRQVPEAVILQMHRRLMGAIPTVEEGFDLLLPLSPGEPIPQINHLITDRNTWVKSDN